MFCYQQNFFKQTENVTPELFTQLVVSDDVVNRIRDYRAQLPELERLRKAAPDPSKGGEAMRKWQEKCRAITNIKSGLPVLMYQATFDETESKAGNKGRWRKQSAARLNGLFMLDVDHLGASPDPSEGGERTKVRNVLGESTTDSPNGAQLPLPSEGAGGRLLPTCDCRPANSMRR